MRWSRRDFFFFFPLAQTQHQIAKELREDDVRIVQCVMRYQNTLDGQHQSHLGVCATRRENSSNARENQKLLSTHTHTHTHTHTRTVKCSSTLSLSDRLSQRIQKWNWGDLKKEVGLKAKINRNKMCVRERIACYDKVGFEREMKEGRISLGTEWCTANDVICSCCCW